MNRIRQALAEASGVDQDHVGPAAINGVPLAIIQFTVNIQPVTAQTNATLILMKGGGMTWYTGGIVLVPPQQ